MRAAVTVEQSWHRVPGGTAVSVVETLRAMAARDDVDVAGVAAWHRGPSPEAFRPPVRVHHLPLPRAALYESWHRLHLPPVQLATGRVDVVHATTFAIPPTRGPLVVTVHDLAFLHAPEHFTARGNRFFRRGLELTRRHADLVVVPSQATWDDCLAAGIGEDRLRLVPHGVRPRAVTQEGITATLRRHGIDRPYVLWCGTAEPRKNLPALLDAFLRLRREVPDLLLVLVGPTGWGDVTVPEDAQQGLRPVGFVPEQELHDLYAGARAFCYPSLREGFGMPVLEAMAHGVPVVTSIGTPMAEFACGAGVLVEPTDTEALAAGLLEATGVRHDALAAAAARRSRDYSWESAAERTVQAYQDVIH